MSTLRGYSASPSRKKGDACGGLRLRHLPTKKRSLQVNLFVLTG
ncbi:hypothetical protein [aff. Roholtiella sp. LEGE 12411]|nr:hypothetical protein [aff. Roholtiella sp. LEGE 12411]